MSVRSLRGLFLSALVLCSSLLMGRVVQANSCSFACQANFIPRGATGSQTACENDGECSRFCATTCAALGGSPRAIADGAHPSTCSGTGDARQCTPCSCIPQVPITCTEASTCNTSCTTTCNAYDAIRPRPAGVQSIACRTGSGAAPACVVSERPASATTGFCSYSCVFGATRNVRTDRACTPASPSECSGSLAETTCTGVGLVASTRAPECVADSTGTNHRCVISCNRPTAVPDSEAGTCTPNGTPAQAGDRCLNNCQTLCGRRGMVCDDAAVQCNGTGSSGTCHFACRVATESARHDDRATTCSFSNDTTVTAAQTLCANRCNAYCAEQGGACSPSPAATCLANENAPAGSTLTPGPGTTVSSPRRPAAPGRTAPVFRAQFPDPFEGRLTPQNLIGSLVRILMGLCGVFFLGVFIYGGLQYLLSAGSPDKVKKGQAALVNAVIGLVVVLFAYVAVSLITQLSDQLQTGEIAPPDSSQDILDEELRPGGTTRATGVSSQGSGTAASSTPGGSRTPSGACRDYYGADPATCASARGGACPPGVTDMGSLIVAWDSSFPPATVEQRDPPAACRTCLQNGIVSMVNRYPGIDTTCVPALVNLWTTTCREACNPVATTQTRGGTTGADICSPSNYNTDDASCSRCIAYWSATTPTSRASTIAAVGCPDTAGKAAVWCATAESPAQTRRPQSGGYCTSVSTRR